MQEPMPAQVEIPPPETILDFTATDRAVATSICRRMASFETSLFHPACKMH